MYNFTKFSIFSKTSPFPSRIFPAKRVFLTVFYIYPIFIHFLAF